jgi:SAM-dependent methyltransferase
MHESVMTWAATLLPVVDIERARVIEVGSYDVNGSLRSLIEPHCPISYLGIDIEPGPGVDQVCQVHDAPARFGMFDLVICTEVLEHVVDWRGTCVALADLVAPGGLLLVTTRSVGFPYHPYPIDTWRYTPDALRDVFDRLGLDVRHAGPDADRAAPGVFLLARRSRDTWAAADVGTLGEIAGITPMTA